MKYGSDGVYVLYYGYNGEGWWYSGTYVTESGVTRKAQELKSGGYETYIRLCLPPPDGWKTKSPVAH